MARKSIAPWSERVSEGLIDQPIDSTITASQTLRATVDTGFIDQTGTWKGIVSSDAIFGITQTDTGVANSAAIITPSKNADGTWPLDMTGFNDIILALKPTNGGNYKLEAIMGPSDLFFGGLSPVDAGTGLYMTGADGYYQSSSVALCFSDAAQALTADVWNIFMIQGRLANQKLLQFQITNNSGGSSNIETAFMRIV